jgi:hypothetical protein
MTSKQTFILAALIGLIAGVSVNVVYDLGLHDGWVGGIVTAAVMIAVLFGCHLSGWVRR